MDGAAGIVCSALADRAGLPDTSERTNTVAALKPRPEWAQGKAESRQLNNHLSSANPPQRAQAPEKSQGSRPARTAQPLFGGLREPAARLWPAAAAQCRGAGPQLPGQSGEHALPSQPALRSFTTPSRGIPARAVLRPSARSLSTDDPSPNWTCRGREPDPPDRRLPPSDKWDGYVHLCLHVLGKGAGGGADLTPVFVFRRHPARSRGFGVVAAATRDGALLQDQNLEAARSEVKPAQPCGSALAGGPAPAPNHCELRPRWVPPRRAGWQAPPPPRSSRWRFQAPTAEAKTCAWNRGGAPGTQKRAGPLPPAEGLRRRPRALDGLQEFLSQPLWGRRGDWVDPRTRSSKVPSSCHLAGTPSSSPARNLR
ncbi:uncharacterized protein LOC102956278 isoform X1 [Panthera tigris]|uniref:uncharacterized protein LOC102956278 isoform X1 n=1 Tax=Panthera tigris TaxID=9694 RepID=UPI001C6F70FE|nr:uncharacterized protein LOC102956278 isoform X1 [Panthera tigris]XP_042837951.1 uncharacterized protein LOC102956278 isoform X1 [Panthera tigris]XP_042837952.1 uncharacterized protein LOC102956278 isoform X1 [Panthera tigris]XP_042837953.1 uncharacterized protein LOC102956278 isoform X1 [Panthera tigris]XP_042837954.1 uncharacterized protein LOC102956278 isoform X1 [Panthera tigris]